MGKVYNRQKEVNMHSASTSALIPKQAIGHGSHDIGGISPDIPNGDGISESDLKQ